MYHRVHHEGLWLLSCAVAGMLLLSLGTGCDPVSANLLGIPFGKDLIPPAEALEYHFVLGGTAERTLIARTPDNEWELIRKFYENFNPLNPIASLAQLESAMTVPEDALDPVKTELIAVNLRTLESEVLMDDLPEYAYSLKTDGRWLAWMEYAWDCDEEDAIQVIDLETKKQSTLFPGLADDRIQNLTAVSDGHLILEAGPTPYTTTFLVIVDLETRETQTIDSCYLNGWYYSGYNGEGGPAILRDGVLYASVWSVTEPFDIEDETPLTKRIEAIDLQTDERSIVIDDPKLEVINALYVLDDRLLIDASEDLNATTTIIREYPLAGGEGKTLLELDAAVDADTQSYASALSPHGILVSTLTYGDQTSIFGSSMRQGLEFHDMDDNVIPVRESTSNNWNFSGYVGLNGWLVDRYVIYRDPETFEYVVFDVVKQTERRFDPFEN